MKRVLLLASISLLTAQENFCINGSFDRNLDGWSQWGASRGDSCAVVFNTTPTWSGMDQIVLIPRSAKTVQISGSMKTDSVICGKNSWENSRIALEFHDGCGNRVGEYPASVGENSGTNPWRTYSNQYEIPKTARQIKLICALGNAVGTAHFDNLSATFFDGDSAEIKTTLAQYESVEENYLEPVAGKQVAVKTASGEKYLVYLPQEYTPKKKFPLVLFLHGSGERGDCLKRLEENGTIPKAIWLGEHVPFIAISPLCPANVQWQDSLIEPVFQDVMNRFSVDRKRITATGLSLGGLGVLRTALAHPDRYAGIVPVAGWYEDSLGDVPSNICDLVSVPAWFIHGAKDVTIFPEKSQKLVYALEKCGGNPLFTLYTEESHVGSFKKAYADPLLYQWLMDQEK